MFFTLEELVKWLGLTVFEIWLHLICLLVFTVLVVLRLENAMPTSWWNVFIPLFIADGLNTYFTVIVFIRLLRTGNRRAACLRLFSTTILITCVFVCQLLLCRKLTDEGVLSYTECIASLFVALQILMIRTCQIT
jgi:ribonuclease P/MRP protein subunit RPP20